MRSGFFGIPLVFWGGACLLLAVVWVFVWPADRAAGAGGIRLWLMRWGHTVTWLLLAAMCFLKAFGNKRVAGWADPVGMAALAVYLGFMAASYIR
jgi:hypothetical protein